MRKYISFILIAAILQATMLHAQDAVEKTNGKIRIVTNKNGQTLGYSTTSGIKILMIDRLAFKDLNKNGKLDLYEDWRLPADVRARDLASKLTVEQIAGMKHFFVEQDGAPKPFENIATSLARLNSTVG